MNNLDRSIALFTKVAAAPLRQSRTGYSVTVTVGSEDRLSDTRT